MSAAQLIERIPIQGLNNESDYFILRVSGNSMYPKIEEGDKVMIRRQSNVDSGDIAAILFDNESATIKKVIYGEDWLELVPINPDYMTKRIEGADLERCRVLGKVVQLIKEF